MARQNISTSISGSFVRRGGSFDNRWQPAGDKPFHLLLALGAFGLEVVRHVQIDLGFEAAFTLEFVCRHLKLQDKVYEPGLLFFFDDQVFDFGSHFGPVHFYGSAYDPRHPVLFPDLIFVGEKGPNILLSVFEEIGFFGLRIEFHGFRNGFAGS